MPIYAYRCSDCGHAQDVLQKIADPVLSVCPACGRSTYVKQVTAAGFQLKGSGWYVTDFRDTNKKAGKADAGDAEKGSPKDDAVPAAGSVPAADPKAEAAPKAAAAPAAAPAPAPAAAPAAPSGKTDT